MNKYSKNNKLNKVLTRIEEDLLELGLDEVRRYYKEFKHELDYNIAQYGNLLIYYGQVYDFYRECGYISTDKLSEDKIWNLYKRHIRHVTRKLMQLA